MLILALFVLIGAVSPCIPIPPGEYRGTLSPDYSIVVGVGPFMNFFFYVKKNQIPRRFLGSSSMRFDDDCRLVPLDNWKEIGEEIGSFVGKQSTTDIRFDGRWSIVLDDWLVLTRFVSLWPGQYLSYVPLKHLRLIEVVDEYSVVLMDMGAEEEVKASYAFTSPTKVLITPVKDCKWMQETEAIVSDDRITMNGIVFDRV